MADFFGDDLRGTRFERVDLTGSEFYASDLTGSRFRGVVMRGVELRGVELRDVDIHGEIVNVTINGVDIWPLVNAELDRRYPDRAAMRPTDPAGFRAAWDVVERRDRMATVREVLDGLTDESLDGHTEPVDAPGWPRPRSYPVRECLLCILDEEWEHRLYAERDLDAMAART